MKVLIVLRITGVSNGNVLTSSRNVGIGMTA